MKNILIIILLVGLVVACFGCVSSDPATDPGQNITQDTQDNTTQDTQSTEKTNTGATKKHKKDNQGETGGVNCPYCGSSKYTEIKDFISNEGEQMILVRCYDCGEEFNIDMGPASNYQ